MLCSLSPRAQNASLAKGCITRACSSDAIRPMQAMTVPLYATLRQTSHLNCLRHYLCRRGRYMQKPSNRTVLRPDPTVRDAESFNAALCLPTRTGQALVTPCQHPSWKKCWRNLPRFLSEQKPRIQVSSWLAKKNTTQARFDAINPARDSLPKWWL